MVTGLCDKYRSQPNLKSEVKDKCFVWCGELPETLPSLCTQHEASVAPPPDALAPQALPYQSRVHTAKAYRREQGNQQHPPLCNEGAQSQSARQRLALSRLEPPVTIPNSLAPTPFLTALSISLRVCGNTCNETQWLWSYSHGLA